MQSCQKEINNSDDDDDIDIEEVALNSVSMSHHLSLPPSNVVG